MSTVPGPTDLNGERDSQRPLIVFGPQVIPVIVTSTAPP